MIEANMPTNLDILAKQKTPIVELYILSKKLDVTLAQQQLYNWAPYTRKPLPRSHPINLKLNRPLSQSQIRQLGLQYPSQPRAALEPAP